MPATAESDIRPPLIADYDSLYRSLVTETSFHSRLACNTKPRRLLVFLPGFSKSCQHYSRLLGRLLALPELENTTILPANYRTGWCSGLWTGPLQVAQRVLDDIERELTEGDAYDSHRYQQVIGLGHSFGGLLLRFAVIQLSQQQPTNTGKTPQERWPRLSELLNRKAIRLALLASPNRGFSGQGLSESREQRRLARLMGWGRWLADNLGWKHLMANGLKGDPWITNLRLSWMTMPDAKRPATIQFNGTDDVVVEDSDSLDIYSIPGGESVLLPGIRHNNFLDEDDSDSDPTRAYLYHSQPESFSPNWKWERAHRQAGIDSSPLPGVGMSAFELIRDGIIRLAAETPDIGRWTPPAPDRQACLVYLVHGIRDLGDWLDVLAQRSLAVNRSKQEMRRLRHELAGPADINAATGLSPVDDEWECIPARYGYFTAFQFLFRTQRVRIARSLADRYVQDFARVLRETGRPPRCYAVAHSHGTFAVMKAVVEHPHMRFERLFLCGSVIARRFPWNRYVDDQGSPRQIGYVRNDCANGDWAVGVMSLAAGVSLPWNWASDPQLGTGGIHGFKAINDVSERVRNNQYLRGDHGAALRLWHTDNIWRYITATDGDELAIPQEVLEASHGSSADRFTRRLNHPALAAAWLALVSTVLGLGSLLCWVVPRCGAWARDNVGTTLLGGWMRPDYLLVELLAALTVLFVVSLATKA